ncbi:uncharacterized protein LOC142977907 [Anticarsia gemmatalis]|uniref:uncharacterized protein LOC142977907 n=1 Tax=Anticarsia gemmatalis TaxID=129554 RepID=UPI003F76514F
MKILYFISMCIYKINAKLSELEKIEVCRNLDCGESIDERVCGMRKRDEQDEYQWFDNECLLLKYGCQAGNDHAYGIINTERCNENIPTENFDQTCPDCLSEEEEPICGIREDGDGFRTRIFENECQLLKYNCEQQIQFNVTDYFICDNNIGEGSVEQDNDEETGTLPEDIELTDRPIDEVSIDTTVTYEETTTLTSQVVENKTVFKNIVVVRGSMSEMMNINNTVADFFASTHVLDLPVQEMQPNLNESARRMLLRVFGPIKVFTPWIDIPKNISEDHYHKPTLSSCFHTCPTKCPDTYAPVCGVPGILAREPSLMFQNHCFMDVAQCKMFWEDKSWTAESSAYIESSFLFCLGDQLNGVYRLLPLIRTLQHMGRLKKKGHFRYKLRNMRYFNELLLRQPNVMG